LQDVFSRQIKAHEREISQLQEKLIKIDSQLQLAIKEKNAAQLQSQSKDRDLSDLQKTQTLLKAKVTSTNFSSKRLKR
jgi:hypothetical protein